MAMPAARLSLRTSFVRVTGLREPPASPARGSDRRVCPRPDLTHAEGPRSSKTAYLAALRAPTRPDGRTMAVACNTLLTQVLG